MSEVEVEVVALSPSDHPAKRMAPGDLVGREGGDVQFERKSAGPVGVILQQGDEPFAE